MADIVGSFQRGQQFGTQQRQQRETEQRRGRLSELAQLAYGAQPMQRQELVRQAIGVDPGAGFELDQSLQKAGEAKMQELVNSARLFINAPETSRPGLMQALKPRLEELGLDVPDYTPDSAAQFLENAKAFVATHGGGGQANLGDRYRVIGGSLVDLQDPTRAVYQAPQRYLTEQGLIEVGPEGAREITLGGAAAAQDGMPVAIDDAGVPPQVAEMATGQRPWTANTPDIIRGTDSVTGQRIFPRGAGAEQERLQLARQSAARSEEASRLAREAAAQRQQFGTIPAGFRVNAAGTALEPVPGGPKPAGAAATEDERKAAGWFNQASRARQNINEVLRQNPGADQPGAYEAFGPKGDSEGPIDRLLQAQYIRSQSPGRQRYNQAISSFAEAVLRAATGAGVNRDEAAQKIRELTPQPGESRESIAQKLRGLDGYLQDLQTRAGRALNPANQNAPTVSTKAQYDALPSGAIFIEDGQQYRKP